MISQPKNKRKYIRRGLIIAAILTVIVLILQYWFINNARDVLKNYISKQSNGKISLELEKLNLNLFTRRLQIINGELSTTDSLQSAVSYQVDFSRLTVNVGSMWNLLIKKELQFDSLKIFSPDIRITQWREDSTRKSTDQLSIPQELGNLYNAVQGALNDFSVGRLLISNARVELISKIRPQQEPVVVSNIYFDLVRNDNGADSEPGQPIIQLRTSEQDILLPDGRHRLAFKSFRLHLYRQTIEMDSCTISATATDSVQSNFTIFYKKLQLTGVDFAALSAENLIRADTVYCENPVFNFNIYRKESQVADPRSIIADISGNLDLAYVELAQAGLNIKLLGGKERAFSNSIKDNFKIYGLRITADSSSPVTVRNIDMLLKDYRLFNQDSSSFFSFGSLQLIDNDIRLTDFEVSSNSGKRAIRNDIFVKIPYFELSGLDWYQFIFNEYLVANSAILKDPVMRFTRQKTGSGKKFRLFDALLSIDNQARLQRLTVINGSLRMQLGSRSAFTVSNMDFQLNSAKALSSTDKESLRNAVEYLSFKNGDLQLKDISARMRNARFTNDNLIYADEIGISAKDKMIDAIVRNVFIDNMQLDDNADSIEVDGFRWESAVVNLQTLPVATGKDLHTRIDINNISGKNTKLNFSNERTRFATDVERLSASTFQQETDGLLTVADFYMKGADLSIKGPDLDIRAAAYSLTGEDSSTLERVRVLKLQGNDSILIESPQLRFSTDINRIFRDNFDFDYVLASSPKIRIIKNDEQETPAAGELTDTPIRIGYLQASSPDIFFSTVRNDSVSTLKIPYTAASQVTADDIIINGPQVDIAAMKILTGAAVYTDRRSAVSGVENGKIDVDLSDIRFGRRNGKVHWSGLINSLDIRNVDGIRLNREKNNIYFENAALGNLGLSSEYIPNFSDLLKINVSAWLRIPEGIYEDSLQRIHWFNANYSSENSLLQIDSLAYAPRLPLDSSLARASYEFDYLRLTTGPVIIRGLDAGRFEQTNSIIANSIDILRPELWIYRDKQLPDNLNAAVKPSPVKLIRRLGIPVSVQKINLTDGNLSYTEVNQKTGKSGTIRLGALQAGVDHLSNTGSEGDSLKMHFSFNVMDTAPVNIWLTESYRDSAQHLLARADIGPADLQVLNPFLEGATNIHVRSGKLDSGSFHFTADSLASIGEMQLSYSNLKLRLLKDGDASKSPFLQNLISFVANNLLIKNKGQNRSGYIYYELEPGQSFIKYSVKSFLSGVIATVTVKNNRKAVRRAEARRQRP